MINHNKIMPDYEQEAYATYERVTEKSLKILRRCLYLVFILSAIVYRDAHAAESVCLLPENVALFMESVAGGNKRKITGDDIKNLKSQFEVKKDEYVIYPYYSKSEKVRFVALSKQCTASDGVVYRFLIAAFTDAAGNAIFSQYHLVYRHSDFLDGKRKYVEYDNDSHYYEDFFGSTFGSISHYVDHWHHEDRSIKRFPRSGSLIVQKTFDLPNESQLIDHIKNPICADLLMSDNASDSAHSHKFFMLTSVFIFSCIDLSIPEENATELPESASVCKPGNFHRFLESAMASKDFLSRHTRFPLQYGYYESRLLISPPPYSSPYEDYNWKERILGPADDSWWRLPDKRTIREVPFDIGIFVSYTNPAGAKVRFFQPSTTYGFNYYFEYQDCWRLFRYNNITTT